jgi:hypothetical protein
MSTASDDRRRVSEAVAARPNERAGGPLRSLFVRWYDKTDRVVTRWALHNRLGKWLAAKLWLPLYAKTGLQSLGEQDGSFLARLPYRRPNRNWYGDMAGSALLAATELAAGEPLLARYGEDYIVVCAHLGYDFLRPLHGPAILQATPQEPLVAGRPLAPFRVTFDLVVYQEASDQEQRAEARRHKTGRGVITFRLTPKAALPQRARPLLPL